MGLFLPKFSNFLGAHHVNIENYIPVFQENIGTFSSHNDP